MAFAARNLRSPARVAAEAGSQPMPSRPMTALASAISSSVTSSTWPPVLRTPRRDFFQERGLPMRMAVAMVSGSVTGESFCGLVLPELGKGIGSGGLHHDHARGAVDEAEAQQLVKGLAEGGGVAEVAAGNDEVVGGLPVELVEQLEHGGLLAFDAEGIDGVEEVDSLAGLLQQDVEGVVEAAFDLDHLGSEVERLGQLVERDLPGGEIDAADESGAGGIGGQRGGGVSGGGAGDDLGSDVQGFGHAGGHAEIFEAAGGVPCRDA